MASNSTHKFPSPVGGAPLPIDFTPSIIFAALYALLLPVAVWRVVHPHSRNLVVLGTMVFNIERIVGFVLRAIAAHNGGLRASVGLQVYFQMFYSNGFVSIGQDLLNLFRSLLVGSTLGGDMLARSGLTPQLSKARGYSEIELQAPVHEGAPRSAREQEIVDQPRIRFWVRQCCGIGLLAFLVAAVAGGTASFDYKKAVKTGDDATLVRWLWTAATTLTMVLLSGICYGALWAFYQVPRVPRSSALWIALVATLLTVVGIYRLTIFGHSTTSLLSTGPGSQNSATAKACFYIFHAAPEFLSAAILMSLNARRVFGTGLWGDLRMSDPKPSGRTPSSGPGWMRASSR